MLACSFAGGQMAAGKNAKRGAWNSFSETMSEGILGFFFYFGDVRSFINNRKGKKTFTDNGENLT